MSDGLMNFHDVHQFPYVSGNAHKLLREAVHKHSYRTAQGSLLEVRNEDIFSPDATHVYQVKRAAAAELCKAGYADVSYGAGDSFSIRLTSKGVELSKYLAS